MKILNLGCETKTNEDLINIDWSIYLKIRRNKVLNLLAPLFMGGERLEKLRALPRNILVYDLSKGIPFPSNSIDVVYHSHFLEHLDQDCVENFLLEVKRVLKPGGIQRIVAPDLEKLCKGYINHLENCISDRSLDKGHDQYIAAMFWQCVMKEAHTTSQQPKILRFIENIVLGDARKRGLTHQWMYDRINLSYLLKSIGFREIKIEKFFTSSIPNWNTYGLDTDDDGREYKLESMYIESKK